MSDTSNSTPAKAAASSRPDAAGAVRRNADAARKAAAERLQRAQDVSDAVAKYHDASDREDAAKAEQQEAGVDRRDAICQMRKSGLTIAAIAELTGLSTSRVQALTKA